MIVSSACVDLIKHYEGFYPKPYICPAGVPTIGYGTTIYPEGKKVTIKDPVITEKEAVELLYNDLNKFEAAVNKLVKLQINQPQFDALVSFAYNLGTGSLQDSTLLKIINKNVMSTAADWKKQITVEFCRWVWGKQNGKPIKLAGLIARRSTEAYLFCDGQLKFFN